MAQILVDTDILIDVANNDAIATERLTNESQASTLAVSTITVMELTVGCRNKTELQALNRFLAQFQVLTLTSQSSEIAAQLLQDYFLSYGLLIADALIAATAVANQIPLLLRRETAYLLHSIGCIPLLQMSTSFPRKRESIGELNRPHRFPFAREWHTHYLAQ